MGKKRGRPFKVKPIEEQIKDVDPKIVDEIDKDLEAPLPIEPPVILEVLSKKPSGMCPLIRTECIVLRCAWFIEGEGCAVVA